MLTGLRVSPSVAILVVQVALAMFLSVAIIYCVSIALENREELGLAEKMSHDIARLQPDRESVQEQIQSLAVLTEKSSRILEPKLTEITALASELDVSMTRMVSPSSSTDTDKQSSYELDFTGSLEKTIEFIAKLEEQFKLRSEQVILEPLSQSSSMVQLHLVIKLNER